MIGEPLRQSRGTREIYVRVVDYSSKIKNIYGNYAIMKSIEFLLIYWLNSTACPTLFWYQMTAANNTVKEDQCVC
jgi:hypothetical protein